MYHTRISFLFVDIYIYTIYIYYQAVGYSKLLNTKLASIRNAKYFLHTAYQGSKNIKMVEWA